MELIKYKEVYPCTIVMDRYCGTYSGGKWLALQCDPWQMPDEIGGSDPDEEDFFRNRNADGQLIGKGDTPDMAYENLQLLIWERFNKTEHAQIIEPLKISYGQKLSDNNPIPEP